LKTEAVLKGQKLDEGAINAAKAALSKEIVPIDDVRSTALYRLRVSANVLEDFLSQLIP
jgi:xanthine dehydrogenase iron-sulfur cluster and FAD-binding subunit A